ncbi:hypothetical protein E2C01_100785 [Portunus trituberculatus]|uniref:Uncharacterized protein n=1 Tax=Portunus trituberculatus TaxID=210409 RepID=A0A5B7K8Y2_PORTR|nr:hypothetical protein [Portunus trituberculatus]
MRRGGGCIPVVGGVGRGGRCGRRRVLDSKRDTDARMGGHTSARHTPARFPPPADHYTPLHIPDPSSLIPAFQFLFTPPSSHSHCIYHPSSLPVTLLLSSLHSTFQFY